jgi:hypothetical protein
MEPIRVGFGREGRELECDDRGRMRRWLLWTAVLWGVGFAFLRVAVVPAERCPAVDAAAVRRSIEGATAWLVRNQRPDGRFLYGYYSKTGRVSTEYTDARHAGVVYVLYRTGHDAAADRGMGWVQRNLYRHDDWAAYAGPGNDADAGANALLIAALMERRLAGGDGRYDTLAREMGRYLLSQMRPDGSVVEYWRPSTGRQVPGIYGKFSTGETFYALALLHRVFPHEGWEQPARRVVAYLATRRDEAEGYATRQPDHWAAYGLSELVRDGLDATEVAYARRLAGYFGYEIRFISQHTGRPLNPFTESGADYGVVGEASSALWRASARDPRLADLRAPLAGRITCLAGITVGRQVSAGNPDGRARGAWFLHGYTQMDDQQHATGALLGAEEVLQQ